jgi:hypothetical protein
MIESTGRLEAMPREELERAYRFAAGCHAPPLPEDPTHAALVVLRVLRDLRQPGPDQGPTTLQGRVRLPFRGFVKRPRPGTLCEAALRELRSRPRRLGDLADDLGVDFVSAGQAVRILNEVHGFAVEEDPDTRQVSVHARPLRAR